jgi:hypothetical protein
MPVGDSVVEHCEMGNAGVVATVDVGTVATSNVATVDVSTVPNTVAKVTWADVAKTAAAATKTTSGNVTCGGGPSAFRHQILRNHRKPVLRSLSQNNPVNRIKV